MNLPYSTHNAGERPRIEPQFDQSQKLTMLLARRSGLNDTDLKRIAIVQDQLGLGFIEAAMRMGLITQSDLDAVLAGEQSELGDTHAVARPSQKLASAHDPFSKYSERIGALRTELLLRGPDDGANVLAVLSAGSGEGRSRLASELAISFAQLGQSTLLVDCDLRRPSLHELFSADNEKGLADALIEGRAPTVQGVIGLPSLSLLTSGPRSSTPLELLSAPMFGELIGGWCRRYQHVIMDTPAVSDFSDALAVASGAGRVLIVVRTHKSKMSECKDLVQRLRAARAVLVGSVLNSF